ncbi:MAG: Metal-dependent phosphohydrolase HD subdomain [Prolixibacteraceae bacterium]|nr:MAG: Metal-dependent phosphohydrolase HD subdomain [Prolixibacteraceae bacterium]
MKEWIDISTNWFNAYCSSFNRLTESQSSDFTIKKEHSLRVAAIALSLAEKLEWTDEEQKIAFLVGLLHDLGRFRQLVEFDKFSDEKSVDHAGEAVKILKEENLFDVLQIENRELIFAAILNHNKFKIQEGLTGQQLLHAKLIRDADKLDIFRVLGVYYANRNGKANHTLTWELPKGTAVSPLVSKEILAGKMVSKKNIASEMDVKIMQLSWVYDLNFRPTFEFLVKNRYLENVYNSLPKNDLVIEIYRKIKVYTENKIMS